MLESGKGKEVKEYRGLLDKRLQHELGEEYAAKTDEEKATARKLLPEADRRLAASIATRDNLSLAKTNLNLKLLPHR